MKFPWIGLIGQFLWIGLFLLGSMTVLCVCVICIHTIYTLLGCVCALRVVYVHMFYMYLYHLAYGGSWVLLCLCVVCLFVSIPFSYVLRVCVCVCVRIIFCMYMEIMGIRFCVYIKQVSKPPHGVQRGMVGMLLFLRGCVDNCIMLCYFLSLQNILCGVALVCLLYVCERKKLHASIIMFK